MSCHAKRNSGTAGVELTSSKAAETTKTRGGKRVGRDWRAKQSCAAFLRASLDPSFPLYSCPLVHSEVRESKFPSRSLSASSNSRTMADSKSRKRQKGLQGQPIDLAVHQPQQGELQPALGAFFSFCARSTAFQDVRANLALWTGGGSTTSSVYLGETSSQDPVHALHSRGRRPVRFHFFRPRS